LLIMLNPELWADVGLDNKWWKRLDKSGDVSEEEVVDP
jgi:hypothetical protein